MKGEASLPILPAVTGNASATRPQSPRPCMLRPTLQERLIRAKQAALDAVYLREGAPLGLPKEALQYWAALVRTRNVRLL